MENSKEQIATLAAIAGLMIITAIIINRVGSGIYLELIQGFLLGLSVIISFVAIYKFTIRGKSSD